MKRTPTAEPVDEQNAVIYVKNDAYFDGFALKYLVNGVPNYQGMLLGVRANAAKYFPAARRLYIRLRKAGVLTRPSFGRLAGAHGMMAEAARLRALGFSGIDYFLS